MAGLAALLDPILPNTRHAMLKSDRTVLPNSRCVIELGILLRYVVPVYRNHGIAALTTTPHGISSSTGTSTYRPGCYILDGKE